MNNRNIKMLISGQQSITVTNYFFTFSVLLLLFWKSNKIGKMLLYKQFFKLHNTDYFSKRQTLEHLTFSFKSS